MTRALVALLMMLSASSGMAMQNELINEALNQNLQERDQVTGTYKQNDAAERPVVIEKRTKASRLPVVLESELTSGSRRLRDYDNPSRTYQESHVEAHLDREVKDVDHAFDKEHTHQDTQKSSVRALLDVEG